MTMPDTTSRTVVLLTGFGPFPTVPVNATMRLLPALAAAARHAFPDVRFATAILPTEWRAAPDHLDALLATHDPDIALHFGVSRRARGFEIERRGRNLCAGQDTAGEQPPSQVLQATGPDLNPVDLPAAQIIARLRRRGIAAHASWDAGQYLCNALLYHSLARGRTTSTRSAFIHIPSNLPLGPGPHLRADARCPLSWDEAVAGGLEIIAVCLGRGAVRAPARR